MSFSNLLRLNETLAHVKKGAYQFVCPVCKRIYWADQRYEPMCTGPSWTDDHEPTVMRWVGGR